MSYYNNREFLYQSTNKSDKGLCFNFSEKVDRGSIPLMPVLKIVKTEKYDNHIFIPGYLDINSNYYKCPIINDNFQSGIKGPLGDPVKRKSFPIIFLRAKP